MARRLLARARTLVRERPGAAIGIGVGAVAVGTLILVGTPALASRRIPIAPGFIPQIILVRSIGNGQFMKWDAARAFNRMKADAARAGVTLTAVSGLRSIPKQAQLYAAALIKGGLKVVSLENLIREVMSPGFTTQIKPIPPTAPPGRSNHNEGVSVDIDTGLSFEQFNAGNTNSKVFQWLTVNAGRYGFVRDVATEPWHWTFKG